MPGDEIRIVDTVTNCFNGVLDSSAVKTFVVPFQVKGRTFDHTRLVNPKISLIAEATHVVVDVTYGDEAYSV